MPLMDAMRGYKVIREYEYKNMWKKVLIIFLEDMNKNVECFLKSVSEGTRVNIQNEIINKETSFVKGPIELNEIELVLSHYFEIN